MFRVEFDMNTGQSVEIQQVAYRDTTDNTIVVVLDADQPAPAGMEVFDPNAAPAPAP